VELVEKAVGMFRRVFLSTGSADFSEIRKWVDYPNVVMLHCVVSYPCDASNINMLRMVLLKEITHHYGYSGHYPGIWDAILAISLGAQVVEKHFTIDKQLEGRDNHFALDPIEFAKIAEYAKISSEMREVRGLSFQEIETEIREVYKGRWTGTGNS